jgi:hypothetical protein
MNAVISELNNEKNKLIEEIERLKMKEKERLEGESLV